MTGMREIAFVSVSEPVDGTRHQRRPARRRRPAQRLDEWQLYPAVLAAAKRAQRDGERMVFVSPTEVLLVPDGR